MNNKEKNLTQEEIDVIFKIVNKLRRTGNREITDEEIEKLIYNVRGIAK